MKKKIYLIVLLSIILLSCEKDQTTLYSFSGKAQKGPFIKGTIVTVNELNQNLGQTGRSYTTSISSDIGDFELTNIESDLGLVLLTANGYFFSEKYGELSKSQITLQAISDLKENESININVLTQIIKERIVYLVSQNYGFHEARKQAKSELLTFFGVVEKEDINFDNRDISLNNDYNAFLLACSIIMENSQMSSQTSAMADLISNLSFDFKEDGQINNPDLINTLYDNIYHRGYAYKIKNNIEERYSSLGDTITVPDFNKYCWIMERTIKNHLYVDFNYPDSSANYANILNPTDTIFRAKSYTVAASIPMNSTLWIKFIGSNVKIDSINGWEIQDSNSDGFALKSKLTDELMSMKLTLSGSDKGTIEYYENNTQTPKLKKQIIWK